MKLSASAAWDATADFLRRHGGLVSTVALAFFALPQILALPFTGNMQAMTGDLEQAQAQALRASPILLLVILAGILGQLAIFTLVLRPGASVGEAIGHGFRRLLPAVGVAALLLLGGLLLSIPFSALSFGSLQTGNRLLSLLALLLLPIAIYLFIRVFAAQVSVADGRSPIDAIRHSWALTRGNVGRIFVLVLLVGVVGFIILLAINFVAGSLLLLLGNAFGSPNTGRFLVAILSALVSALVTSVFLVLLAQLYRQLSGATAGA